MTRKITFATLFVFWLGMNYLLWNTEYGGGKRAGSSIPVALVWEKMLKAPDSSALEIAHRDKKLGFLRWMPNISEELGTSETQPEEDPVEGRIQKTTGYSVDIEGSVVLVSISNHLRGNVHIEFGRDFQWITFHVQAQLKSGSIELDSRAADRNLKLKFVSPGFTVEHTFTEAELQNPASLLESLELPAALLPFIQPSPAVPALHPANPAWQAFNDTIRYGHNTVHVYRLSAKLWDRFEISLIVSRAGEILRVELPNNLTLKNDILFLN
jgi:hypothetical protein